MIYKLQEGAVPLEFSKNIDSLRSELDEFYTDMNNFSKMPTSDVLQLLAGMSARASYVRGRIMRLPENRSITNFRTKELDPFIEECDRQFRVWSRAFSVQAHEWEITKGL